MKDFTTCTENRSPTLIDLFATLKDKMMREKYKEEEYGGEEEHEIYLKILTYVQENRQEALFLLSSFKYQHHEMAELLEAIIEDKNPEDIMNEMKAQIQTVYDL